MKGFRHLDPGLRTRLGGPGLLLIGFLDSSFLSLPEVNDLLVIFMVTQHKHLLLYYSLMATIGSVLGCLALYFVARKGGEAFLRKRFKASHVERGLNLLQKYGLLVVIVPALLPPPAPFKIFVLLAGVAARSGLAVRRGRVHGPLHPLLRRRAAGGLLRGRRRARSSRRTPRRPASCWPGWRSSAAWRWIVWQRRKARA